MTAAETRADGKVIERDSDREYQRRVELMAAGALVLMMLVSALAFANSKNMATLDRFNQDLGLALSFDFFKWACVVGALIAPLTVIPPARHWRPGNRRTLYLAGAAPLLLYTVPVGYVVLNSPNANAITGVAYLSLYVMFIVVAIAVFRPVRSE